MSYFNSPAQTLFLELSRAQGDLNQKRQEQWASRPGTLDQLVQYSEMYPQGSASLGLALLQGGIPATDPMAGQLVQQEMLVRPNQGPIENEGEGFWDDLTGVFGDVVHDPLKGATRWAMSAWDAAYNMVFGGAPIRALMLSNETGMGYGEAWREQDPYFFEALGGVLAGEQVNLGSGWLPGSDVADDVSMYVNEGMMKVEQETQGLPSNQKYVQRLEAAPEVWRNAVAQSAEQAAMGKPLTELARVEAESVMFDVPRLGGGRSITPWSPGRIGASLVVEPGTTGFKWASGTGDFLSQMFLDPVDWGGLWMAKMGKAGRLLKATTTRAAEEIVNPTFMGKYADATRAKAVRLKVKSERVDMPLEMMSVEKYAAGPRALPAEGVTTPLGVADETGRAGVTLQPGRKLPWWYSGENPEGRILGAFDPPRWYVDTVRTVRNRARGKYAAETYLPWGSPRIGGRFSDVTGPGSVEQGGKTLRHFRKRSAGWYEMDMPRIKGGRQKSISIRKVGKGRKAYWDVTTPDGRKLSRQMDDPRFTQGDPGFRTLKEAQEAARREAYESVENLKVHGMTPQEFIDSGEAVYIQNGQQFLKDQVRIGPSPDEGLNNLRRTSRSKPLDDNNTKVVVFGRTADIADRKVAGKPKGLIDALKRDRKIRGENISGNPRTDSFTHTRRWMEENGYGKLDLGDDDILISEKYIGGDPADASQRFFTEDPSKPMRSLDLGDGLEPISSVSADEVNAIIDFYARQTGDLPDSLDVATAERILEARRAETPTPELGGVRVDYDEEQLLNTLSGKRADLFTKRLAATTRAGGQSNRAAMDRLLGFITDQKIDVPLEYRKALFEAPDEASVRAIFARMMTERMGGQLQLPGRQYGRIASTGIGEPFGRAAKAVDRGMSAITPKWDDTKNGMARRMAQMLPSKEINMVDDPAKAYSVLEQILPNYNVRRGQTFLLDDGTLLSVEDAFDRLLDIQPGDLDAAFDAMSQFSQIFFASLKKKGVSDDLAKQATDYFGTMKEMSNFNTARLGQQNLKNGPVDGIIANDSLLLGLDGPQITSQAWGGAMHFPDAHTVKLIANETDVVGRFANRLTSKLYENDLGMQTLERRAWNLVLTNTMNRIWKPFVLLRAAWTIRIMMDDQMRIAADGYGAFNHPLRVLNYALMNPGDIKSAFRRGSVDVFGESISLDNLDNLRHGDLLQAAAMKAGDPRIGRGSYGYKHRVAVDRGSPLYTRGQASNIRLLRADPIMSMMAGVDPTEDAAQVVARWLTGKGVPQRELESVVKNRNMLATFNRKLDPEIQKKIVAGDYDTIYELLSHQEAMMRQTVGGRVVFDDGKGGVRDYTNFKTVDDIQSDMSGIPKWRVIDNGDQELLDIIAKRGKSIDTEDAMKELERMIGAKVQANPEAFPNFSLVSDPARVGLDERGIKAQYDKVITGLYEFAMTMPSDKFSRVPLFRKAYWDKMGQLSVGMDPATAKKVAAQAKAANAAGEFAAGAELARKYAKVTPAEAGNLITNLERADEMAKAYGLMQVDKTLFDLVNKKNISDSLNLIFPFVEAWMEFLTRWGRMMVTGDRNIANMRRLQQGVEGLREDSGFFYENEFGDEVFNYPAFLTKGQMQAHNLLNNLPFADRLLGGDIDPSMADSITFTGQAQSLNFAHDIIPGFGPVFQQAVKVLNDDPKWDGLKDIIAPYGTDGTISPFMPAWMKRIATAHGGAGDPTLEYTWNATVQDVVRTMMSDGAFSGVTSQTEVAELLREAEDKARGLLMVRAAAAFALPVSPATLWTKEDRTGQVWTYGNLGEEYRKIKNELGAGDMAAHDEFVRRFGFIPGPFSKSDTYNVVARSLTETGSQFERANQPLFDQYPNTAMYLDPNIGIESGYDQSAMLAQLRRAEREQWTPEQMVYVQQDLYGDMMMDAQKQESLKYPKGEARNAFIANAREEIEQLYPFWNKVPPGKRQGASPEEKIAEVVAWTQDPALSDKPVVAAARAYLRERDTVLAAIRRTGASTIDGPTSAETTSGQVAALGRDWLRAEAERISQTHPEFDNVFKSVFSYEVREELDAPPEPNPESSNAWGEGDILEAVYGMGRVANG